MKVILLSLCCLFLFLQGHSATKLKICLPSKPKLSDLKGGLSLEKTLEALRKEGDEVRIPGTFPLHLDLKDVISGDLTIADLTISGFLNTSICLFPKLLDPVNITINTLKIVGESYKLQCSVSDLMDLHGNGKFEINLEGISIAATSLFLWPLNCAYVNLDTKLQKMGAKFENMMDGDEVVQPLINAVIGDLAPDCVDYYWPQIYKVIEPLIQKVIDKYVNKVELANIIAHLSNQNVLNKVNKKNCYTLL